MMTSGRSPAFSTIWRKGASNADFKILYAAIKKAQEIALKRKNWIR